MLLDKELISQKELKRKFLTCERMTNLMVKNESKKKGSKFKKIFDAKRQIILF